MQLDQLSDLHGCPFLSSKRIDTEVVDRDTTHGVILTDQGPGHEEYVHQYVLAHAVLAKGQE